MEFNKIPGMECIYLDIQITLKFQIHKLGSIWIKNIFSWSSWHFDVNCYVPVFIKASRLCLTFHRELTAGKLHCSPVFKPALCAEPLCYQTPYFKVLTMWYHPLGQEFLKWNKYIRKALEHSNLVLRQRLQLVSWECSSELVFA